MNIGIYTIKNLVNNKLYIGSSSRLNRRYSEHKIDLNKNKHCNIFLQRAWDKYGQHNFVFEIVEYCDKNQLLEREEYWINYFSSYKKENGYNICIKPKSGRLGIKSRQETIEKIRQSLIGKSTWNKGRKMTKAWLLEKEKTLKGIPRPNSGCKKQYTFISPIGEVVTFIGLRKFCRENNLRHTSLWQVSLGKQKEYKGWKRLE